MALFVKPLEDIQRPSSISNGSHAFEGLYDQGFGVSSGIRRQLPSLVSPFHFVSLSDKPQDPILDRITERHGLEALDTLELVRRSPVITEANPDVFRHLEVVDDEELDIWLDAATAGPSTALEVS